MFLASSLSKIEKCAMASTYSWTEVVGELEYEETLCLNRSPGTMLLLSYGDLADGS